MFCCCCHLRLKWIQCFAFTHHDVNVSNSLVLLNGVAQVLVDSDDAQSVDLVVLHHAVQLGSQHDICNVKSIYWVSDVQLLSKCSYWVSEIQLESVKCSYWVGEMQLQSRWNAATESVKCSYRVSEMQLPSWWNPATELVKSSYWVSEIHKLQAPVYNILPSTTAVFSYAIGSRKLSAKEQFFVGAQTVVSLLQATRRA